MEKLMIYFLSLKSTGSSADEFSVSSLPYVETDVTEDLDVMIHMVMSGAALILGSTFSDSAIIVDAREYPARETSEPESDRVMRGARDGFVETLIFNTALIRRRIRDTALTMHYISVGSSSKTDVIVCYRPSRPGACREHKEKAFFDKNVIADPRAGVAEGMSHKEQLVQSVSEDKDDRAPRRGGGTAL